MTSLLKERKYGIAGFVILLTITLLLTKFGNWFVPLLSVITVAGVGLIFYTAGIRWAFHMVLLTLPLSVNIALSGESQVRFPSELLVAALGISVLLYWLRNAGEFFEWLSNPLTVALSGTLCFILLSVGFSEMMMVSVKSVIIKSLYVISFYGGAYIYFKKNKSTGFIGYYMVPLLFVIGWAIYHHADYGFSKDVTGYVTKPFYQDHTIYSAAIAFMFPLVLMKGWTSSGMKRVLFSGASVILFVALVLAVSRAAWISVGAAIVIWLLVKSRASAPVVGLVLLSAAAFIYVRSDDLMFSIKSNRYDSGARNADLADQTKSILNITNDQSNAERLNRWKCALRMFREKPFTGFGPGTYQFQYLSFQREEEMTRISVKSAYNIQEGKGGTAHNEILLVLAESGIIATLFFILSVILVFVFAIKICYREPDNSLHFAFLFALTTFTVHSLFNNFMDTDKAAALFYMALAYFASAHFSFQKVYGKERG